MTFIHPLLLGGLLLVGIPVLIHMVMRQKPKHLLFPAVRFLLQRQQSNRRRLQLRHLILLAMRMLLIAAICLALARPRVLNERLNLAADQPVDAVMIFDTSFSMGYTTGGKTRLELAVEHGLQLLKDFPDGSRIAAEVENGSDKDVASIRPIENPKRPLLQHRPSKRAPKRRVQMRKLGDQVQQTRQFAGKSLFGTWPGIA